MRQVKGGVSPVGQEGHGPLVSVFIRHGPNTGGLHDDVIDDPWKHGKRDSVTQFQGAAAHLGRVDARAGRARVARSPPAGV